MKSDSIIQQEVYEELMWTPNVTPSQIGVTVKDGVVMLSGEVPNFAEKHAAELAARRIGGVKGVAEEIIVKQKHRHTDADITRAAIHALEWHVWVPKGIMVVVENGCLTLTGQVDRQFQKNIAEKAVKYICGVVDVTNRISVKASVMPEQVKKDIAKAFQRNAQLDAQNIVVQAGQGNVRLSGSVRSWAERREAERAAWAAPGVVNVENAINVSHAPM